MRIFRQLLIILSVWLVGEIISAVIPFPIPGNVIGMILMLILLLTRTIRVQTISQVSSFLLDNISFFFIPSSVALMVEYKKVGDSLIPAFIAVFSSTLLVFIVTAFTAEYLLRLAKRRKEKKNGDF